MDRVQIFLYKVQNGQSTDFRLVLGLGLELGLGLGFGFGLGFYLSTLFRAMNNGLR